MGGNDVGMSEPKSYALLEERLFDQKERFEKQFSDQITLILMKTVVEALEEAADVLRVFNSAETKYPYLERMEGQLRVMFAEFLNEFNSILVETADFGDSRKRKVARGKHSSLSLRLKIFAAKIHSFHELLDLFPDLSPDGIALASAENKNAYYDSDLSILSEDINGIMDSLMENGVLFTKSYGESAENAQQRTNNILAIFIVARLTSHTVRLPAYVLFRKKKCRNKLVEVYYCRERNDLTNRICNVWNSTEKRPVLLVTERLVPSVPYKGTFHVQMKGNRRIKCYYFSPIEFYIAGRGRKRSNESNDGEIDGVDTVIIHYHGGGFMANTPRSHQSYTRKWSNDTGYPIISVDYTLSSREPFPAAIDDCYDVLRWVAQFGSQHNIPTKKIVLVGDSAGGNLVAAVTVKSIIEKTRIPDKIVMAYPALQSSVALSPSRLFALEDPVLSIPILRLCAERYTSGRETLYRNVLYSPVFARDKILEKFPETKFTVGFIDPLRDDVLFLAYRLMKLRVPVNGIIYTEMSHGYLGQGSLNRFAKKCIEDMAQLLKW